MKHKYLNGWCRGENVVLLYRNPDGQRREETFTVDWYFYVKTADVTRSKGLFERLRSQGEIRRLEVYPMNTEFTRVYCENLNLYRSQVDNGESDGKTRVRTWLREAGIETYEADLSSLKRFMIDGEHEVSSQYKVIFLDIETQDATEDGRRLPLRVGAYQVLSFSVTLLSGKSFFVTHRQERVVLEKLAEFLEGADLVGTYNGDNFDLPYIKDRFDAHEIFFNWKKIQHIDFFQRIFELYQFDQEIEQYDLGYIANALVPHVQKFERGRRTIMSMWTEYLRGQNKDLETYNNLDTKILRELDRKENVLAFMIQLCCLCRCFVSEAHKSWLIDSFILREGFLQGRPLPSKNPSAVKTEKYEGAYVFEPEPGLYEDVDVFDYNSLYPNIIRTWNIGTADDTMVVSTPDRQLTHGQLIPGCSTGATPNASVWYQLERTSMLAHAVGLFLDGRARVRAKMKAMEKKLGKAAAAATTEYKNLDLLQKVWKILANSTYGILGSVLTRYFDIRIAESITHGARVCLDYAATWFKNDGRTLLYGDTDSNFVQLHGATPEEVLPRLHGDLYAMLKKDWGCAEPTVNLAWEHKYRRLLIVGKKHYGGFIEDGTPEGKFYGKGQDHKKRAVPTVARKILEMLFRRLTSKDDGPEFYDQWLTKLKRRILEDPIPEDQINTFVIKKKVKKDPGERGSYVSDRSLPLHVQIYQDLQKAGHEVWIPYVVKFVHVVPRGQRAGAKDGVAIELYASSGATLDRRQYWEVEIFSRVQKLLEAAFPSWDWAKFDDDVVARRKALAERALETLKHPKTPATWWKTMLEVMNSPLLRDEHRQAILKRTGLSDPAEKMELMRLELAVWAKKRLKTGITNGLECCKVCSPGKEAPVWRGSRKGRIHAYDTWICQRCGYESSTKLNGDGDGTEPIR